MIGKHNEFKNNLIDIGVDITEVDYHRRGYNMEAVMTVEQVRKFAKKMYDHNFYLVFVGGFQVQPEEREDAGMCGLEVVYQFAKYDRLCRVKGHVSLPKDKTVPSLCDIYQGANWHERETHDFYGVIFDGHPNPKPLLLPEEDQVYHPLLKAEKKLKTLEAVSWSLETSDGSDNEPKKKSLNPIGPKRNC